MKAISWEALDLSFDITRQHVRTPCCDWHKMVPAFYSTSPLSSSIPSLLSLITTQGRRNRGGRWTSPPIFETGAFLPPKNYTTKYLIFKYFTHLLLFWKCNTASCHRPHVWRCMPPTEPLRQFAGLGAVGISWSRDLAWIRLSRKTVWDAGVEPMKRQQQRSLNDFFLQVKKQKKGNVSWS